MDGRVNNRGLETATPTYRPFLKWAGNKFRIIDKIKARLPAGKRLIEPFAGSGAVFLNTDYPRYLLCDSNPDLINLYTILKDEGPKFIRYCMRYFNGDHNNPDSYYQLRDHFNQNKNIRQRAALFVYFNRHGYNGLCRYNSRGGFNVPFGRYLKPYFPEQEMLVFHEKAQKAQFKVASFEQTMNAAKKGDVIYCDPPYAPLTSSADFTSYSPGGFSLTEQTYLAELALQASKRDIPVLLSNHDTQFTRETYHKAATEYFHVRRYISCNGQKRNHAGEVLALYK